LQNPVAKFEEAFADKIGSKYAIAVNSGTSALHASLVALDVKGGEVIMPALCPAMDAFAIIHAGATSVFADVDPQTHLVTHDTLAKAISPRTKAIIAVALHGLPCDIDPIMSLAATHKIAVIEDCAQALLAPYKNTYAGVKADFGCFSFEKKKHLTTGSEGGMIITNNPDLAMRARKFAGIGYKHMTAEAGRTSLNAATFQRPDYTRFDTIGLNYRLSEMQAELGLEKLRNIDEVIKRRQEIGAIWESVIGPCQPHSYEAINTFYSASFEYDGDWEELYNAFVKDGGDGFYSMPQCPFNEPAMSSWLNNKYGGWDARPADCVIAEQLQKQLMIFKTHYQNISYVEQQAKILASIL